jgi:hypothetical protein
MGTTFLEKFISCVRSHRPAMASLLEGGVLSELMISEEIVSLKATDLIAIEKSVAAFELLRNLPAYQAYTRSIFPADHPAQFDPGYGTIFDCLDFHITPSGPKLIEINTNASGSLLSAFLRDCHGLNEGHWRNPVVGFQQMIQHEWQQYIIHGGGVLGRKNLEHIAIIDSHPKEQRTHFEFRMFQELFNEWGFYASIADPSEIEVVDSRLVLNGKPIDLIYNRLTDFYLEDPAHRTLLDAYLHHQVCLTPHPHGYGMLADKERLTAFSQEEILRTFGLPAEHVAAIEAVTLKTFVLTKENAPKFWDQRKQFFFKPQRSHGGKSAYRGSSISRTPFDRLTNGSAVAQEFAEPGKVRDFKYDLRAYTHLGKVILDGARLFQGQLLNFKTPGGGFAAVQVVG